MTALWSPDDQPDEISPEEVTELARMGPPPQPARVWVKASWVGEIQGRVERAEAALDAVMAVAERDEVREGDQGWNLAVREVRAAVLSALGGL